MFGLTKIPLPVAFSFAAAATSVDVPGEGDLGPTAVVIYREHLGATVTSQIKLLTIPLGTVADLVISGVDGTGLPGAGAVITDTLKNMVYVGVAKSFNRAAPPGSYDHTFTHKGAMDSAVATEAPNAYSST
jgi:hypothetical protein